MPSPLTASFTRRLRRALGLAASALLPATLPALDYAGGVYTQNFDSLVATNNTTGHTWTNDSTLPGWFASRSTYAATDATLGGSAANFVPTATAANVGLFSFGTANATDRAFGFRSTSSITSHTHLHLGLQLVNTSPTTLSRIQLRFNGEQWLRSSTTTVHSLIVEYKLGSATLSDTTGWTALSTVRFYSPDAATTAAATNGNASPWRVPLAVSIGDLNWNVGQQLWIRFTDSNESGNEHGLAVDDVRFEASTDSASIVTGPWSGGVTPSTATVCAALDQPGIAVRAVASLAPDLSSPIYSPVVVSNEDNGFAVRLTLSGLAPDSDYYYSLELDGSLVTAPDQQGRFRTFPTPGPASFRFAFGACGDWTLPNQFTYDAVAAEDIRLFLHLGDFNYADTDSSNPDDYRANYRQTFTLGRLGALLRRHASGYIWDDHDYSGNDSDRYSAGRLAHRQVYREIVPHYTLPDAPAPGDSHGAIYQTFTLGRVKFILTDLRSERESAEDPDDDAKTMMGSAQKAWFKQQLLAARDAEAPLIVWASSVPFLSSDAAGENWSRYAVERTELLTFIRDQRIQNVVVISGDMHALAADDGRGTATYVAGVRIPIFQGASFNRAGSIKGGPYSLGTSQGDRRYATLAIQDDGVAPVSVTYQGRIVTASAVTTLWNQLVHVTEPVRPLAPTGLTATPSATGVTLAWTDASGVESGYRIERADAIGGPWTALLTTAANATSHHDETTTPGTTYHYRLVALNLTTAADPTTAVAVTTHTELAAWKLSALGDAAALDTDDRDRDGHSALLEYAIGGDPLVPDQPPGYATLRHPVGADEYLGLEFTRNPARTDITVRVIAGDDLGNLASWTEVARSDAGADLTGPGYVSGEVPGSAPRVVHVRDVVASNVSAPRRFLRVEVIP